MKKHLFATFTFLLIQSCLLHAQNTYEDATSLSKLNPSQKEGGKLIFTTNNDSHKKAASILSKYVDPNDSSSYSKISQVFFDNPFFELPDLPSLNDQPSNFFSKFAPNSIGGFPVTTFADGLARFMVKRMKEELSVMFFDQFQRELENQKDLQLLFPSTHTILETAKREIYNYQKFLPALREAFVYDMDELLENTYKWTTETKTDIQFPILNELRKKEQLHNSLKIGIFIGNELDNGQHPGEILSELTKEEKIDFDKIHTDMLAYLKVLDLFSQSLKSNTSDRYWITKDEAYLFQDDIFLKIYLGLIYQTEISKEEKNQISFSNKKKFSEILKDHKDKIEKIKNFVVPLSQEIVVTQNRVSYIIQNEGKVKTSDYFNLFGNILKLAELTVNAPFIIDDNRSKFDSRNFSFYVNQTSFLYANIKSKAYPAAVYNTYAILSKSMENSSLGSAKTGLGQFLKYGTFMATVATSESSEEVADAIEAVALPPGSARIKREAAWNISFNSYLGGFYGSERLTLSSKDTSQVAGVFAPVGLAFSRNFSLAKNGRGNFSASLFTSIIDIGALASFRLDTENDKISTLPEIKLENIISPGLYGIIGLPRVPISIGGGYQVGPVLREVTADNLTLGSKSNRWSLFVAVDIPLVNFWTRSRKVYVQRK